MNLAEIWLLILTVVGVLISCLFCIWLIGGAA